MVSFCLSDHNVDLHQAYNVMYLKVNEDCIVWCNLWINIWYYCVSTCTNTKIMWIKLITQFLELRNWFPCVGDCFLSFSLVDSFECKFKFVFWTVWANYLLFVTMFPKMWVLFLHHAQKPVKTIQFVIWNESRSIMNQHMYTSICVAPVCNFCTGKRIFKIYKFGQRNILIVTENQWTFVQRCVLML